MVDATTTCPPDCRCDPCLDAWWADLRPNPDDRLAPWDFQRHQPWPTRKPRHTN